MEDNEIRIFPFYRGQFMGRSNEGYSNKKSALKYMMDIPDEDVYEKFGGEDEYMRIHKYFRTLKTGEGRYDKNGLSRLYQFRSEHSGYGYGWKTYDDIFCADYEGKVYLKDIPEEQLKEMLELNSMIKLHTSDESKQENVDNVRLFEKKYNLFPGVLIDYGDFEKMKTKIRKNEIVYKKGIVKIEYKIDYLDDNV